MIASIPFHSVSKTVRKTNKHFQWFEKAPLAVGGIGNAAKAPPIETIPLPDKDEGACADPKVKKMWEYLECVEEVRDKNFKELK